MSIYTRAICSVADKKYLDIHFPMWQSGLLPTEVRDFRSDIGRMNALGTIEKNIEIPNSHGNVNIYLEFALMDNYCINEFLLGTDYKRMNGIRIHKIKSDCMKLGDSKEKEFLIYSNRKEETNDQTFGLNKT
ncbi:hypothetical protein O181_094823 [Austropuccinia psidii MF-1]|uniref:Uncharacterized protein n=1 Tax=Austropuccinia psidii MF-1 TaxID=1389203 RepID=A0A9Q3PAL7_9BASI|nr:hypothetical protein [Austropuccinia psidii MF-1]